MLCSENVSFKPSLFTSLCYVSFSKSNGWNDYSSHGCVMRRDLSLNMLSHDSLRESRMMLYVHLKIIILGYVIDYLRIDVLIICPSGVSLLQAWQQAFSVLIDSAPQTRPPFLHQSFVAFHYSILLICLPLLR
mgnify:CR=1 FL=1